MDKSLVATTDVMATVPGVMFCVKSIDGVYLAINQAFAKAIGLSGSGDVVGRTAFDLFPVELAKKYEAQDKKVLETGHMLTNELELIPRKNGKAGWFLTSKSAWTENDGSDGGIVSVSVDLNAPDLVAAPYPNLAVAVEFARTHFAKQVTVTQIARAADMEPSQLERVCRRVLGYTPKQLLMRFRIEEALRLLQSTNESTNEIAVSCGYYDQSDFTNHFRKVIGYTPLQWRSLATRDL